jgi:hypothetical protein
VGPVKLKSEATPRLRTLCSRPKARRARLSSPMGARASAHLLSATAEIATRCPAHQLKKEVQALTTLPFTPSSGDGPQLALFSESERGQGMFSS